MPSFNPYYILLICQRSENISSLSLKSVAYKRKWEGKVE